MYLFFAVFLENGNEKKPFKINNNLNSICMITCYMCQFLKTIINHMCRLIKKPVEFNDLVPSPNFEYPTYVAEEEEYDEIPEEVSRLLQHEESTIQPYKEPLETINLGTKEDPKEVKIGALLHSDVKSRLIELLKEYVDIFVWYYQDMSGLDTDIVEHHLPLKPECPPIKQKL